MTDKYLNKKLNEIDGEICIAVAFASFVGCMQGKCTDGVIEARDTAVKNVRKKIGEILRRENKSGNLRK